MMIDRCRILHLVLLGLLCAALTAHAQPTSSGRRFLLTLPYTSPPTAYEPVLVRLLLTSESVSDVTFRSTATGRRWSTQVVPGAASEVILDSAEVMLPQEDGVFPATIEMTATEPVSATLLLDRAFASESIALVPDSLLGFNHLVVSGPSPTEGSVIAVMATRDGTTVTITPSRTTRRGDPAGAPFSVRLQRGEVFQLLGTPGANGDLTRTRVDADAPISVIAGAICGEFRVGARYACNPLIETIPPIEALGDRFALAPLAQQADLYMRVLPLCPGTVGSINGRGFGGGSWDSVVSYPFAAEILSSGPLLVAQYATSTATGQGDLASPYGDPSMMLVPRVGGGTRSARFIVPALAPRTDAGFTAGWRYFLQVAIPRADSASLAIDGLPPTWVSVGSTPGSLVVGAIAVSPGEHHVTADTTFVASFYGYSILDAFASPLTPPVSDVMLRRILLRDTLCGDQLDTTLRVTNPNVVEMVVDSLVALGELTFTSALPLPFRIPAGGSIDLPVTVRPGKNGTGFIIGYGGSCRLQKFVIEVDLHPARATLVPGAGTPLLLGPLGLSEPGDTTITLRNTGTVAITIDATTAGPFTVTDPPLPIEVEPGDSLRLGLWLTATDAGVYIDTLLIRFGPCDAEMEVPLRGERVSGGLGRFVGGDPLRQLCGQPVADTGIFLLANLGSEPLTVDSGVVVGVEANEFTLTDPSFPAVVAVGETLTVRLVWRGGAPGVRRDTLVLFAGGLPEVSIRHPLDARGDVVRIAAATDSMDIGLIPSCSDALERSLVIRNIGTAAGELEIVSLSGRLQVDPAAAGLREGDSIAVVLRARPVRAGRHLDTLHVRERLCGEELSIAVTWQEEGERLRLSRDTIDFGVVPFCDSLRSETLLFENRSDEPDTITLVRLPDLTLVDVNGPTFPLVIEPGGLRTYLFHLRGGRRGDLADSIVFFSRLCGEQIVVPIVGSVEEVRGSVSDSIVDFGFAAPGSTVRRSVMLRNPSRLPMVIDPLLVAGAGVRVVSPSGLIRVEAGDSVEMVLEYTPTAAGERLTGELIAPVISPCVQELRVRLVGRGSGGRLLVMEAGEGRGMIGEEASIPLALRWSDQEGAGEIAVRAELEHDATLFLPLSVIAGSGPFPLAITGNTITDGRRRLRLEGSGLLPAAGGVWLLRGLILLGDSTRGRLSIADLDLSADQGTAVTADSLIDGLLIVEGACEVGGDRLVAVDSLSLAGRILPNPTPQRQLTLLLDLIEDGAVVIEAVATDGSLLLLFSGSLGRGGHLLSLHEPGLVPGFWLLRVRSSTTRVELPFVVRQ